MSICAAAIQLFCGDKKKYRTSIWTDCEILCSSPQWLFYLKMTRSSIVQKVRSFIDGAILLWVIQILTLRMNYIGYLERDREKRGSSKQTH